MTESLLARLCTALTCPFTSSECVHYEPPPPARAPPRAQLIASRSQPAAAAAASAAFYPRSAAAAAPGRSYADVLPCGLTRHQVRLLEEREITPDDYTLLLLLEHTQVVVPRGRGGLRGADLSRALQFAGPAARNRGACAVCLELVQPWGVNAKLRCGHAFHRKCISTWLQAKNTCPLCARQAID